MPSNSSAHAVAVDDREHAAGVQDLADALGALLDLLVHVGDVEARDRADAVEEVGRALRLVGVDVDLQRVGVADHEHGVAEALEARDPRAGLEILARDGEVRAVAVGASSCARGCVIARRRVVLQRRRLVAAQRRDHAREDDRQAVAAGVDDAGVAQDRQQLGAALDGRLAGVERVLEHVGEHLVLRRVVDAVLQPRLGHVRDLTRRAGGHLAHDREDRALGGVANASVGAVRGAGHGGGDQHGVDQLAGARRSAPRRRRGSAG